MRRGFAVLLALAFFSQGCSSSYEPARSPRIAMVVESGQPTFVKNGERLGSPAFGGGLVDAVASNPEAQHQATIGRNWVVGGLVLDLVGLGSVIGGTVVLAKDNASTLPDHPSTAGTALLIGGLAAALAGSVMILCGQPHIYDAVNIYNDGLEPRVTTPPTPPPTTPPLGPRVSLISPSTSGSGN